MSEQTINDTTTTAENDTPENPPTLDLSNVTADEYRTCLERVLAAGAVIAQRHMWCSGWTTYLMNVSPHYQRNGVIEIPAEETLNRDWFSEEGWNAYYQQFNAKRGEELRLLRGRILTYAESNEITVEEANEVFAAAGLPAYTPDPDQHGYVLYFGGSIRTRRDTVSTLDRDAYTALVREQEIAFLNAVGYAAKDVARGSFITVEARRLPQVRVEERADILYRA